MTLRPKVGCIGKIQAQTLALAIANTIYRQALGTDELNTLTHKLELQ
ncbi:MAG: hypothetical protein VKL39_11060 [Leptolyngbyaceae bacterium]|nr:hypothetical protein [Leptolyngbyaceae bacterium]